MFPGIGDHGCKWSVRIKATARFINMYGFTRTANKAKEYFAAGNWFWPETPTFDKDGFTSFEAMADGTYIVQHGERKYDEKIYLWPLPSDDVLIATAQ